MTQHRINAPRTPNLDLGETPSPTGESPGLTTFSTALTLWKKSGLGPIAQPGEEGCASVAAPGPQLLHDQALPPPPPGLPSLHDLLGISHAAADRARRVLNGIPLPTSAVTDAVHIADTARATDPTPAYRLDLDLGLWRERIALHRSQGCAADQGSGVSKAAFPNSCRD